MKLNIWTQEKNKTIAEASPIEANHEFYELLKLTGAGQEIIRQLLINHELAIMDFNEALSKLNSKDP